MLGKIMSQDDAVYKPYREMFDKIFGEQTPDFEKSQDILSDWTFEQYVDESIREGRAVRYSREKFEELKAYALKGK